MHPVSAMLSPLCDRTALQTGTPRAPRSFSCVCSANASRGRGTESPVWEGAHTDQVPSPRLRTALGSYKHHICIALKKQSHVM